MKKRYERFTEKTKIEFNECLPMRLEGMHYSEISKKTGYTIGKVNMIFQMFYKFGDDEELKTKLKEISKQIVKTSNGQIKTSVRRRIITRGKEKCTCCGRVYSSKDMCVYPKSKKILCRYCMYGGVPDPIIDVRSILSPMANNGRFW